MGGTGACHDLLQIQLSCRLRRYRITIEAERTAQKLSYDEDDILDAVLALKPEDFHKTMPSETFQGRQQDVYRPAYLGRRLYVKLDLEADWVTIISFKEDTSK